MAVMARILDIPARVAVGFLVPQQIAPGTFEYTSYDLHAWPELFFPGSGWVRFEPTPAGRAEGVPGYTAQDVPVVNPTGRHHQQPAGRRPPDPRPERQRQPQRGRRGLRRRTRGRALVDRRDGGWRRTRRARAPGAAPPGAAPLAPGAAARPGGPEEAWAELRATALDLGVPWPEARSPRATRQHLVQYLGKPVSDDTPERPPHGPRIAPEAVRALDRIVRALELSRYAREGGPEESPRADVETCLAALYGGAPALGPAPRRVVAALRGRHGGPRRRPRTVDEHPVEARYGGVVDHVG